MQIPQGLLSPFKVAVVALAVSEEPDEVHLVALGDEAVGLIGGADGEQAADVGVTQSGQQMDRLQEVAPEMKRVFVNESPARNCSTPFFNFR